MRTSFIARTLLSWYHFAWACLSAFISGFPSRKIKVVGVTGTKGKSTVLEIISAILEAGGYRTALLSSVRVKVGETSNENCTGNTMPGRGFLERFLREAVRKRCEFALIEVTSQGVLLHRHRFVDWRAGVVTNIAPEHIEAHGSFEKYRDAKLSFMRYVAAQNGEVFLNKDDEASKYFFENLPSQNVHGYFTGLLPALPPETEAVLPGAFNKQNIVAAIAVARHFDVGDAAIMRGLKDFRGIPGRMEYIVREPFSVVVDYAHTPDSLEAVYRTTKEKLSSRGRLIAVLGSAGGGRDKWKRPVMGKIAAQYAEAIILTNEDPWDEDPASILRDVAGGVEEAGKPHEAILDRKEAILRAVSLARPGDCVVITGKGSEPYLHVAKGKKLPWSDAETVREAVQRKRE